MTLKEYLERVKNGKHLVIHTPTQEDYDKLMQKLDKTEVKWYLGDRPSEHNSRWNVFQNYTCINLISDMSMTYYRLDYYNKVGYTIIPFSDLTFDEPKPKQDKQLTPRQRATYELIKANSEQGRMTSQKEIYANYAYDKETNPKGYRWNDNKTVHDKCISVWFDINAINFSSKIEKIIISDNDYNYKLAESLEEVQTFAKTLYYDMAMAKLARYGNLLRKAKRNGQGKLLSVNNVPIDKTSKARPFVEAFIPNFTEDLIKAMESEEK